MSSYGYLRCTIVLGIRTHGPRNLQSIVQRPNEVLNNKVETSKNYYRFLARRGPSEIRLRSFLRDARRTYNYRVLPRLTLIDVFGKRAPRYFPNDGARRKRPSSGLSVKIISAVDHCVHLPGEKQVNL